MGNYVILKQLKWISTKFNNLHFKFQYFVIRDKTELEEIIILFYAGTNSSGWKA